MIDLEHRLKELNSGSIEHLTPYWKQYSDLNISLDYLPLGSKVYAEI